MSVCEHDAYCPGYGLAHEAELTQSERLALNIPAGKPLSRQKVKRLIRTARKLEREADA